jgi:hypothetical protein
MFVSRLRAYDVGETVPVPSNPHTAETYNQLHCTPTRERECLASQYLASYRRTVRHLHPAARPVDEARRGPAKSAVGRQQRSALLLSSPFDYAGPAAARRGAAIRGVVTGRQASAKCVVLNAIVSLAEIQLLVRRGLKQCRMTRVR